MTYENFVKAKLVNFVMEEAGHYGGYEPMLAVAQVLANRVAAGWCGGDWRKVIHTADDQRGTEHPEPPDVEPRDSGFRELLRRIDDVYHGTADDSNVNNDCGKALYYAELHNITRPWFTAHILSDPENHPRLAAVAQITFFG